MLVQNFPSFNIFKERFTHQIIGNERLTPCVLKFIKLHSEYKNRMKFNRILLPIF